MKKHYLSLPLTTLALTLLPASAFAHESTFLHSHGYELAATAAVLLIAGIAFIKRKS